MPETRGLRLVNLFACGLGMVLSIPMGLVPRASAQEPIATKRAEKDEGRRAEAVAKEPRLTMSDPVACLSIDGYENYVKLPGASLTADEKLQVYYRPRNYKSVLKDGKYVVHLTQDGQIRKKGQKDVLLSKKKLLDFQEKSPEPLDWIFLRNSISLKGLPPGEYEYDLILHDEHTEAKPVTRTLRFRVVAAALPASESETPPKRDK